MSLMKYVQYINMICTLIIFFNLSGLLDNVFFKDKILILYFYFASVTKSSSWNIEHLSLIQDNVNKC